MLKCILNMNKKQLLNYLFLIITFSLTLPGISIEDNEKNFNPKPASASVYNLGLKSYEQGDIQSAITYFKRAIDLDPGFVDAYYNLGAIYKSQKNYYDAISSFQKAISINPGDYEVIFELASCYYEQKDFDKAKQYFSSIPDNFPKYNEAKQKLSSIDRSISRALALENKTQTEKQELIKSPEFQGQLLADKLGTVESQRTETTTNLTQVESLHATTLLQKPTQETFNGVFKVITDNLKGPTGIVKDKNNNFYIANFAKDSIEKISTNGQREVFIEKAGIKGPVGLAIDENDNLYVANYYDSSIVRVTQNKEVSYLVQKLDKPYYLLYDSSSKKLYATSQGNNSLVEIDTTNIAKQPITSR